MPLPPIKKDARSRNRPASGTRVRTNRQSGSVKAKPGSLLMFPLLLRLSTTAELEFFSTVVVPLVQKLREANFFGRSSDKVMEQALHNCIEWKTHGGRWLQFVSCRISLHKINTSDPFSLSFFVGSESIVAEYATSSPYGFKPNLLAPASLEEQIAIVALSSSPGRNSFASTENEYPHLARAMPCQ